MAVAAERGPPAAAAASSGATAYRLRYATVARDQIVYVLIIATAAAVTQ